MTAPSCPAPETTVLHQSPHNLIRRPDQLAVEGLRELVRHLQPVVGLGELLLQSRRGKKHMKQRGEQFNGTARRGSDRNKFSSNELTLLGTNGGKNEARHYCTVLFGKVWAHEQQQTLVTQTQFFTGMAHSRKLCPRTYPEQKNSPLVEAHHLLHTIQFVVKCLLLL